MDFSEILWKQTAGLDTVGLIRIQEGRARQLIRWESVALGAGEKAISKGFANGRLVEQLA